MLRTSQMRKTRFTNAQLERIIQTIKKSVQMNESCDVICKNSEENGHSKIYMVKIAKKNKI
jgi:hypothetical protein